MAKVICKWCDEVIRDEFQGEDDSHGICPKCLAAELKKLDEEDPCASQQ